MAPVKLHLPNATCFFIPNLAPPLPPPLPPPPNCSLYFGESNVEGMLNTLLPLHEMMRKQGPTTLKEIAFVQARAGRRLCCHPCGDWPEGYGKALLQPLPRHSNHPQCTALDMLHSLQGAASPHRPAGVRAGAGRGVRVVPQVQAVAQGVWGCGWPGRSAVHQTSMWWRLVFDWLLCSIVCSPY